MSRLAINLIYLSGEKEVCIYKPDAKVADVKKQAKVKMPSCEGPMQTLLVYDEKVLNDSREWLLKAAGHREEAGPYELKQDLILDIKVVYDKGDRKCSVCEIPRHAGDCDRYDELPRLILKCSNGCAERICLKCWDWHEKQIQCPKCGEVASEISTITDTENIARSEYMETSTIAKAPWSGRLEPRIYQRKAYEAAIKSNRIIVLPTGTGKTFVAVMLIDHFLRDESKGAYALVLVNQVALVEQHAKEIEKSSTLSNLQVAKLAGGTMASDKEAWEQMIRGHQVLVSTAETIRRAVIDHAFFQLDSDCKLLIVDEAHHAIQNHPYVQILQKATEPRLVGLTACFLHGKFHTPHEKKAKLEKHFRGEVWVPEEKDIKNYLPEFTFERVDFAEAADTNSEDERQSLEACLDTLREMLNDLPENLSKHWEDCTKKAAKVLQFLGIEAAQFYVSEGVLQEAISKAMTMQRVSQKDSFGDKVEQLERLRAPFREKFQSIFPVRDRQLQHGVTPKVLALIDRLKELSLEDCRCIVFVKEVASTFPLAHLLQQHVKEGVRPLSGRSSMGDATREKHLEEFKNKKGTLWCLVATDSIEEGIDIQTCNVVVRFDIFHNVKSHIQGAGRCRGCGKGGLILYFENDPEEYIWQAESVQAIAGSSSVVVETLNPSSIACAMEDSDPSTGATLTKANCISLLNSYVQWVSKGRQALEDIFVSRQVPLPDGRLLEIGEERSQPSQECSEKSFALEALRKLREGGWLDEHHRPIKMSTAGVFPCSEPGSSSCKRHPRMSDDVLKAVSAKKTEVARFLERGREQKKDPKSIFNDCAPVILDLRRPLEKSDFEYLEVGDEGTSGCFRCQLKLRGQTFTHVFRAGEPGKNKKEAERNAAASALQELEEIVGISTCDAPDVLQNRGLSGSDEADEDAADAAASSRNDFVSVAESFSSGLEVALRPDVVNLQVLESATMMASAESQVSTPALSSGHGLHQADELQAFCDHWNLSSGLLQKMQEEDIRHVSDLLHLTEEEVEELCKDQKFGERARLRQGIKSCRHEEQ